MNSRKPDDLRSLALLAALALAALVALVATTPAECVQWDDRLAPPEVCR